MASKPPEKTLTQTTVTTRNVTSMQVMNTGLKQQLLLNSCHHAPFNQENKKSSAKESVMIMYRKGITKKAQTFRVIYGIDSLERSISL